MADTFIQRVRFDERGLIPAVVQDASTNEVIALCYVDSDTLARSLQTGVTSLFSEADHPTGKTHKVLNVQMNPDGKSLTVQILRDEGEKGTVNVTPIVPEAPQVRKPVSSEVSLVDVSSMEFGLTLHTLYSLIAERKKERPDGSYTTYLFNSGLDKILKKVAEESGEVIIAAKNKVSREMVSELADLIYHLLVLMVERDVKLSEVGDELTQRAAKRQTGPSD
jgi:phosphoribosyl-AMP cyclohydrolase / phosphoribosyl-ATP pyrophosphohydrolase